MHNLLLFFGGIEGLPYSLHPFASQTKGQELRAGEPRPYGYHATQMAKFPTHKSNKSCIRRIFCFANFRPPQKGQFLYVYANEQEVQTENKKCVCTRATSRVHTAGGVSSDTLLQVVLTVNRGCDTRVEKDVQQTGEMYNYTSRLYIYAKQTARESRICVQLFFRTKIDENFSKGINN